MQLISQPALNVATGRLAGSPSTDTRVFVYLQVIYSYSCTTDEIKFIEDNNLVILEKLTIVGYDPAGKGNNDIDLSFGIRPQFMARPSDIADASYLKKNNPVNRDRTLFVLKTELLNALNVNGLSLSSVKANVQLAYAHIGESVPTNVP